MDVNDLLRERYRVLHRLGGGGGGQVYKALQLSTGQHVAIKWLTVDDLEEDAKQRRLERFRREIAFCSQLYHPEIVRLVDSGELENGPYFAVFEYIPGNTLAELLREHGMLTVQRSCHLMAQLLPPLAYAHAKGIFHRDLKPGNVMVTADGSRDRVKILDFGISIAARVDDEELRRLTLSQEWVGTAPYAAPEQLRGEPLSGKADLYAWGLVFLECLAGAPVVTGRTIPEVIEKHLLPDPHPLPSTLKNHRLGALLARVLEKDSSRRLGDAGDVLSMLETVSVAELEDAQGYLRDASHEQIRSSPRIAQTETLIDQRQHPQAERRHSTVVCCKITLSGSGDLSNIEQLDTLVEDAATFVREIMAQFGANLSHSFGEYSLSYFGLSRTRDADASLALRGALETVTRLERGPAWLTVGGFAPRAQIGIHNGPVTVRRREGNRRQIDGVTAGIAMRLAALGDGPVQRDGAPTILVTDGFRELVARQADFELKSDLPRVCLPGSDQGLAIYQLGRASQDGTVIDLAVRSAFVGRKAELESLHGSWKRSRAPAGVATLINGEPGIGKSRLTGELFHLLESEGVSLLEIRCLPEWENAFMRPLTALFLHQLGAAGKTPREASEHVELTVKKLDLKICDAVPLLCTWLSLPVQGSSVALTWSPQKRRQLLHEVVADTLIGWMELGAALLVEDLHWADQSTLECLDVLFRRARNKAAFVVMTTRPDRRYRFSVQPEELTLLGLDSSFVKQLAMTLAPDLSLDVRAVQEIADRADGVPLYVEELALSLRSRAQRGQATNECYGSDVLGGLSVPPSLRDLLISRLEDVGEAKRTAQFASALGRDFSLELLAGLSEREEFTLLGDLEQLVSTELLVKRLRTDGSEYSFRHALIREAAYDSMPAPTRQRTHERIAEGLERTFQSVAEAQPDILAQHWERAGDAPRAIRYWQLAATKSAASSAHLDALAQLERALSLLGRMPASPGRSFREAELILARGATIVAKRGYTDPDAARSFERVLELIPAGGDTVQLAFSALWGLWYFYNTQANLRRSQELATELGVIAQRVADSSLGVSAWEASCQTNFYTARFEESIRASRSCANEYVFEQHRHLCTVRGDDPYLACLTFEARAELVCGRFDLAQLRLKEGFELAERLASPTMNCAMHAQAAWVYLLWGSSGALIPKVEQARHHASLTVRIATAHGFPFWVNFGGVIDAAARIAAGEWESGASLREASENWRAAGASLGRCWHLAFLSESLQRRGQYDLVEATLHEALQFCREHESHYLEPDLHRRLAELLLDPTNPRRDVGAGLQACDRAVALAKSYGARWWHLSAMMTRIRCNVDVHHLEWDELRTLMDSYPHTSDEPPLVREARSMVASHTFSGSGIRPVTA